MSELALRAAMLYAPIAAAVCAWMLRPPPPRRAAGVWVALAWNGATLLALNLIALRNGWWTFHATGAILFGVPADVYLGWCVWWSAVPVLVVRRWPMIAVVAAMVLTDLVAMPRLAPVLVLGDHWLAGEVAAIVFCLVPALLLARWTEDRRHLAARATLLVIAFGAIVLGVIPAVILAQTRSDWSALGARPSLVVGLLAQLVAIPVLLGVSAVQEFAQRGGGTPLPFDPPQRRVMSGPYAFVANPMQLSLALTLLVWGALLDSWWVAAGAVIAFAYGAGLAAWDEGGDMERRYGPAWRAYRTQVRDWMPRWRPYHAHDAPPARLYVARSCGQCSAIGAWIAARAPVGLEIIAAESHPCRDLWRITYDPRDGTGDESGVAAMGRALEHINFGWAYAGMLLRLPLVRQLIQLIVDASGGGPTRLPRDATCGLDVGAAHHDGAAVAAHELALDPHHLGRGADVA
ncbi:MAG: isoprenylcysteine carboxylmethyltransferase family protein [Gemmatimonadota bacterium]|nr:isoprenylcysteine carboxylmethyltransferase family protein [Gemmatimonadota bacterium]